MVENGFHISLLGTGEMGFYERLGWESLPIYYSIRNVMKEDTWKSESYEFSLFNPMDADEIPQGLMVLYEDFHLNMSGWYQRNEDYWDRWILGELKREYGKDHLILCHESNILISYLIIRYSSGKCVGLFTRFRHQKCRELR